MAKVNINQVLDRVQGLPDDYWIKRFKAIEKDRYKKCDDLKKEFAYLFELVQGQVIDEVSLYFSKYGTDGIVGDNENNVKLTRAEVAEIKAKVESVEKDLKEYNLKFDKDIEGRIKKINTTNTRLDGLKLVLGAKIFYLYTLLGDHIYHHMEDIVTGAHSHMVYEVFKACGYGSENVKALTEAEIATILALIWRSTEETFDDVVWRYGRTFLIEVTQYIGRATFSKQGLDDIKLYITRRFEVKQNELDNLVRTDSTYFATNGSAKACERLEIEEAVFTAIIDERTSDFCLEADGNIIPIDDIRPWENAPPLHFFCRSTLRPVVREINFLTGEIYEVDTDDYDGWYEQYYE